MKNSKRKLMWDRGGVAEVIGTILTLAITVTLFSSIILMVDQFPAPGDNVYTDFTATIEPVNNSWPLGAFIHITNTGGQQMTGMWTLIAITVDDYTLALSTQGSVDNRIYGLGYSVYGHKGTDNGDDNWDTGERWTLYRDATKINMNSDVSVIILDQGQGALAWSAKIQGRGNSFGPIISNIKVDSNLESLRFDPIQYGLPFYIFADVSDRDGDLDVTSVNADLSFINSTYNNIPMTDPDGDGTFMSGPIMGPSIAVPIGYHIAIVRARDISGIQSMGSARVAVGLDLGGQPNLVIYENDISVSTKSPIHGQTISIAATIKNYGGSCNGTVYFYDIVGTNTATIGTSSFTVSQGPTQITLVKPWIASPGGEHTLMVEAVPFNAMDATPEDNYNYSDITVLPKILLVDDDNHPPDLSDLDTVSYMRGALESSDFGYDLYTVGPHKDGPGYNVGEKKLTNYDVVIWMTGYEKVKTLTVHDQANITSFLNDVGMGRGGSLWMIGQYLYDDIAIPPSFFTDVLKASGFAYSPLGPTNPLMGIVGNPISNEWNTTFIPIIERAQGYISSYQITPGTDANITFRDPIPVYADAINYEETIKKSRLVFFPWEFSRIRDTGDQTQVAYKVLKWLGNITLRNGNDLAVSEQVLEPSFVFFNQIVRVDAVIRNNGETDIQTDYGLFVDDNTAPYEFLPKITVPGGGGSVTVSTNWIARELGTHVLKWKVDPNDLIDETNEKNNEVPSYITSGEVYVEFRILVVDDDASSNNVNSTGVPTNDTAYLTESLNRLGYTYEAPNGPNTTYVVPEGEDGPPLVVLKDYSAVLWMTGESPSGLSDNDASNLDAYLTNHQGMLWLFGNNVWSDVTTTNLSLDMGINNLVNDTLISGTLRGKDNSNISHGMNISVVNNPNADILVPTAGAEGVFYQSFITNRSCAVMNEGGSYKAFTAAFTLGTLYGPEGTYLAGNNATDELVYMLMHWMEKPETRKEVRITERDYFVSDWHPQIGGAYILRATIHNVGAGEANLLVRFMDGTTQIGSDSISVSPDSMTSAELIWRPLFAGQRTIDILVDPIGEVDEIFQWFNNNVTFGVYVYFFWDNMESGTDKWTHASTLMNINGEGPLDFLTASYTSVNTNVSGKWDWTRTVGVENTTAQYHSHPNSFYMEEPTGAFGPKADVLLGLVIDSSPSMFKRANVTGTSWFDIAKLAAITLVDSLTDDSAVGIWSFKANSEIRILNVTSLSGGGRAIVIENIANIANGQHTVLWDAIGSCYQDVKVAKALLIYASHVPALVVLSDGCDLKASDQASRDSSKFDAASDEWAPRDNMSAPTYPIYDYTGVGYFRGKYTAPYTAAYPGIWDTNDGNQIDLTRKGLLYSDIPIYTVGLALEHHDPPNKNPLAVYPGNGVQDSTTHITDGSDAGTNEYNLWRISNTSGAEYFYAPNPEDLEDIFETIGQIIGSGGFNQTRSSTPAPGTKADNFDKKAVSPAFDLSEYESATFSFWHKYNMLSGGNGGIIGVEVRDPSDSLWKFLYIIPPGAYTGGIYYGYTINDDFGNLIKWCFNGISGRNTFSWDHISVDVMPFIETLGLQRTGNPDYFKGNVRMAMKYMQFGGGTGVGWYIDDVKLDVSRAESTAILANTKDIWKMTNITDDYTWSAHSGDYAWSNMDPVTEEVRTGIDNSLMTKPIDLTNAKAAYLSAYFKFNFNQNSGAPPDGFRVEISRDGGVTWLALNLGIRTTWGVSGTGSDAEDGNLSDGKAYTGIGDSGQGNYTTDGYWVSAGSLSRLSIDITPWSGSQVIIRFRMVDNNLPTVEYPHNNNNNFPDPGFGGFFIDDVNVYGETIFG